MNGIVETMKHSKTNAQKVVNAQWNTRQQRVMVTMDRVQIRAIPDTINPVLLPQECLKIHVKEHSIRQITHDRLM